MRWFGKEWPAWKEPLAWTVVGLGLLLLSIVLTFPYEPLQARLIGELQRETGMEIRAADWSVGYPVAIEWRKITIAKADWAPLQVDVLRAQIGLWRVLTGGLALDLTAHVEESVGSRGTARVTMTIPSWSMMGPLSVSGKLQQLELAKLIRPYVTRGTLTGEFTQQIDRPAPPAAPAFREGTWKAEAKDLALDQIPVGNGRTLALAFSTVSLGVVCREQVCEVTELKGDGIDGSVSGQGKITVHYPLQQSQLALSLTVIPGVGFAAKAAGLGIPPLPPGTPLTFKVMGTLAQARVAL